MDGFLPCDGASLDATSSVVPTLGVGTDRPSKKRPWMAFFALKSVREEGVTDRHLADLTARRLVAAEADLDPAER
jgi:hypothetical protein